MVWFDLPSADFLRLLSIQASSAESLTLPKGAMSAQYDCCYKLLQHRFGTHSLEDNIIVKNVASNH